MKSKPSDLPLKDRKAIRAALDLIYNTDCNLNTLRKNANLKKHFFSLYSFKLVHITQVEQRLLLTSAGEDLLYYLNSKLI